MTSRLTLSLSELEVFVTVVEHGNFSRAAAALGLSQPTVSQRMQTLENQCGLKLLDRRHGVQLTDNGREIYNRARSLLAGAGEIETIARELGGLARGRLKIGFSTPPFAMQVLAKLRGAYPSIDIAARHGNTPELLSAIADCALDVGVMTLIEIPDGLRAERIAPQRPMLCVEAGSPFARRRSVSLKKLENETVILREPGSLTRRMFEMACEAQGVHPDRVLTMPGREAVKEAVAAGLGVGVVLSGEFGGDVRLAAVEIANCHSVGGIYAVSLYETTGLPLVDAFFAACTEAAQQISAPAAERKREPAH